MIFLAEYLHRLNPVLIRFTESIQLRWYGIAYVMGFMAGWWLLVRWARKGVGELRESEVADFITYAALFGVLLGGRLGYMLLYARTEFLENPLTFFKITNGGMASHGGIAGLFFFTLYFAIRHKRSWTGLGDNLVCAAPIGLFFGRIANFINGELYGRMTHVAWAMKFPEEATRWRLDSPDPDIAAKAAAVRGLAIENGADPEYWPEQIMSLSRGSNAFAEGLRPLLTARHPSQLYAAALEGVLLFAILYTIREKYPKAPHGLLTGLFFICYAILRIIDEQFREPDRHIYGFTEGQYYSLFMIAVGIAFLIYAKMRPARTV
ncbi:MAG: Prolipoprotein diacylglyceryl transferase [Verrucomicrobiales bacterium]|nr:Prolipoprotein diacylglyceryl transferase [Verrucomicrobiales bacterium]